MSIMRRFLAITLFVTTAGIALDDNARLLALDFLHDSRLYLAGPAAPLPMARPAAGTQFGLHDCLRGTARLDERDAYSAYCADLASLVGSSTVAAELPPAPPPSLPSRPAPTSVTPASGEAAEAMPAPHCLIDAGGITSRLIDGVWTRAPAPVADDPERRNGRSSRILRTPPDCTVQSPADALVLYAGTFKGYLGIVILDTGHAERLTVAGLTALAVRNGDRVSRGAILGRTPSSVAPALAGAAQDGEAALLYVEDEMERRPAG